MMDSRSLFHLLHTCKKSVLFCGAKCPRSSVGALSFRRFESDNISREKRIEKSRNYKPFKWEERNQFYYPKMDDSSSKLNEILQRDTPLQFEENEKRCAEFYFARSNVPFSPKKLFYFCHLVRNMWIEDAFAQLSVLPLKGARIIEETLQHAQKLAVEEHHIEFKWNLHVALCAAQRSKLEKGIKHHFKFPEDGSNEFGHTKRRYSNIQLLLREGPPCSDFKRVDGYEREQFFLDKLRKRRILHSW